MPQLPEFDRVVGSVRSVLHAQSEALAALPGAVQSLASAARSLAEVAASARDTVQTVHRMAARLDGIVTELEPALRALAPGLQRVANVLDDPTVAALPQTLKSDVLPVLRTLADTHERVVALSGATERILTFVDETGRALGGLPGAALLGRRRPPSVRPSD